MFTQIDSNTEGEGKMYKSEIRKSGNVVGPFLGLHQLLFQGLCAILLFFWGLVATNLNNPLLEGVSLYLASDTAQLLCLPLFAFFTLPRERISKARPL